MRVIQSDAARKKENINQHVHNILRFYSRKIE